MLLLALQTTTSAAGDGRIDELTLVLVVIFIAAMLGLSLLIHRRDKAEPCEPLPQRQQPDLSEAPLARRELPATVARDSLPVWLQGVRLPTGDGSLSDAAGVIEALLSARRRRDLAAAVALFAPSARAALAKRLGFDSVNTAAAFTNAMFEGDPPALHGAEIVEASGIRMKVRATYSNRASEIYTLTRIDETWFIEEIIATR